MDINPLTTVDILSGNGKTLTQVKMPLYQACSKLCKLNRCTFVWPWQRRNRLKAINSLIIKTVIYAGAKVHRTG